MQDGSGGGGVQKIRTFAMDSALAHDTQPKKSTFIPPKAEAEVIAPQASATPQAPTPKVIPPIIPRAPQKQTLAIPKKEVAMPDVAPLIQHASKKYITLEEDTQKITVHRADSILSDNPNIELGEGGGTIIRDTKHKRFQLLPAMAKATTQWFEEKKVEYEDYTHPYESMTKAEARTDVIHAAVEKSAQAPREDFNAIVERKKYEERKPISSTLIIKEKSEVPAPQWSYVEDEPGNNTPSQATAAAVNPEVPHVTPTENPTPITSVSKVAEATPATPLVEKQVATGNPYASSAQVPSSPQPAPNPIPPTPPVPKIISEVIPPVTVEPEVVQPSTIAAEVVAEPIVETIASPVVEPTEPEASVAEEITQNPYDAFSTHVPQATPEPTTRYEYRGGVRNGAPIPFPQYALIAVVFVAILSGIGLSVYLFAGKDAPQEITVAYTVPQLIRADQQIAQPLTDRNSFLSGLTGVTLQNSGVVQMYPSVRLQDGSERPASAQETLGVLETRMPSSFTRAIRELTFGAVGNEPFMVMRITSFDIAFAGMLEWEQTMSADLSPLYGTPVIESFDPSARTDSQARSAFFKDIIASNKNARLLFDEKGNDRLIYSFVDQHTIVITTNRTALEQILPLLP